VATISGDIPQAVPALPGVQHVSPDAGLDHVGASGNAATRAVPVVRARAACRPYVLLGLRSIHHDKIDLPAEQIGRCLWLPRLEQRCLIPA